MLHACTARFDVTGNLENFLISMRTKQGLYDYPHTPEATLLLFLHVYFLIDSVYEFWQQARFVRNETSIPFELSCPFLTINFTPFF